MSHSTSIVDSTFNQDGSNDACMCRHIVHILKYPPTRTAEDPDDSSYSNIPFGYLVDAIEQTGNCSFCRLISRTWDNACYISAQGPNFTSFERPVEEVFVWLHTLEPSPQANPGLRHWWTIDVQFNYVGKKGSRYATSVPLSFQPRIALVAEDVPLLGTACAADASTGFKQVASVRRRQDCYDAEFIRDTFQSCSHYHGDKCSRPVRETFEGKIFELDKPGRFDLPTRMRFIDVRRKCVASVASLCEYAVLSYVWGGTNFLTLQRDNISQLETPGSLASVTLPKTIDHAMQVTRSLGLDWLWIDSLCVIQDDPVDQARLIGCMDLIYTKAAITIVAAGSNGVDDGLWQPGTEQILESCYGLRFVALEPKPLDVLESSIWSTRAWTYQEYVLSKRLLVFSERQAYFLCERSACVEDLVYSISSDGTNEEREFDLSDETPGMLAFSLLQFPVYWRNLVKHFTKRTMSFHTDVIRSSAGVVAAFLRGTTEGAGPQITERVLCGLPISIMFTYSLMWFHGGQVSRRGPNRRGKHFPSWSWVGWQGQAMYEDSEDEVQYIDLAITKWHAEDATTREIVFDSTWINQLTTRQQRDLHNALPDVDIEKVREVLFTQEDGVLCFSTVAAPLVLRNPCFGQTIHSSDHDCRHTGIYRLTYSDSWVGGVHLTHMKAAELLDQTTIRYEVIVLARTSNPWFIVPRTALDDTRANDEGPDPDEHITLWGQERQYVTDEDDEAYNIMLVVQNAADSIVHRAGIGQVSKRRFDESEPQKKSFRLA